LQLIFQLLEMDWEVKIDRLYHHKTNKCVDILTNLGCDKGDSLIIYEQCPPKIRHLFLVDIIRVSTPIIKF